MIFINALNFVLKKIGVEFVRFPKGDLKRRIKMLKHFNIDLIIDVGANKGEYTLELIELGYKGSIVSIEPLSVVYQLLELKSKKYKFWNTLKIALGDFDGETEINVAGNINSSSLLDMLPNHINSSPNSKYIRKEKIVIRKLDSIFSSIVNTGNRVFIKIDVQGYERQLLTGAVNSLNDIVGIQVEMSLEPLYDGSILFEELIEFLEGKGFQLYSIENGFSDPETGKLLQIDGIFFKK